MGEYAEQMLNGELCESCGVYLENEMDIGIPMYCSAQCAKDGGVPDKDINSRIDNSY